MFALILDLAAAVFLGLQVMSAYTSGTRGTNAFTKTVRDGMSSFKLNKTMLLAGIVSVAFTLLGGIFGAPYAGVPTLGVAIAAGVLRQKMSKSEERVKAVRATTKGALKTGGAVAGTAGAITATVATGGNAAAGYAVGKAIGTGLNAAADNMTDVNVKTITEQDVAQLTASLNAQSTGAALLANKGKAGVIDGGFVEQCNDAELIDTARKLGISTKNKSAEQVAQLVINAAPAASIAAIEEKGITNDVDKAKALFRGA